MIPEFDDRGFLPAGVHDAGWEEFCRRYAISGDRRGLVERLEKLLDHLYDVGCRQIFVDGSFVTDKAHPNDYDACWDVDRVKAELLDPVLMDFSDAGKAKMEEKYGGDIRPSGFSPREKEMSYLEFFQIDRDGKRKGIVRLDLSEWRNDKE